MSNPIMLACHFVPRKPEIVLIGKTSVSLYPKVDATMSDPEKALAYQQNRTALATADLDQRARILALAERLDLMLTVEASLYDWEHRLAQNWYNFNHLIIISWHDGRGRVMTNTAVAGNPAVLLPIQNGNIADCRAEWVTFVRVSLALDFSDLSIIDPPPACVLRGTYYIELPQGTVQMTNGAGNAYNLTTYIGPADLTTLSSEDVKRDILDETHQDGPFDLLEPSFLTPSTCRTDSTTIYGTLKTRVVTLASESVHRLLFSALVPGYSMEPNSVLDHIWQTSTDDKGVPVRKSAQVYFSAFQNAMRSFYDMEEYPIDVAGVFMSHIDSTLMKGFKARYPDHAKIRDRSAVIQRKILYEMLAALSQAESDVSNILEIVGGDKRGGEQFHGATPSVSSFPSVAERTLSSYKSGDDKPPGDDELQCFGCGGPHPWSQKKGRNWIVTCPKADQPGIRAHAQDEIAKFRKRRQKKAKGGAKRKNLNTVNWDDLPPTSQERILLQQRAVPTVLASDATSVTSTITGTTGLERGNVTLHQDVVVLNSGSTSKPPIPVTIHSPMAHITLLTGCAGDEKDCPNLRCVLDSGAALSTANFHFMEAVIRQFPHILKKIYLPDDYAAIVLSGIVQTPDSLPVTTELPVGFEIHLPYSTKDGNDTSLLVAAGPDVAVNLVLGLPFIKATGMVADFVDNVCEAKNLLCEPFPIDFKRATKSVPVFQSNSQASDIPLPTFHILGVLKSFFDDGKRGSLPHLIQPGPSGSLNSRKRPAEPIRGKPNASVVSFHDRWIPPGHPADDSSDYTHQVLGDLGYL